MPYKLFINFAPTECSTGMVWNVFDILFDDQVIHVYEDIRTDKNGKFKVFWIILESDQPNRRLFDFIDEITDYGSARVVYESIHGDDRYWQVCFDKQGSSEVVPRVALRSEDSFTLKEKAAFEQLLIDIDQTRTGSDEEVLLVKKYIELIRAPAPKDTQPEPKKMASSAQPEPKKLTLKDQLQYLGKKKPQELHAPSKVFTSKQELHAPSKVSSASEY